jgi:hypothetical protein
MEEIKKAIIKVLVDGVKPIKEGEAHYDCDFRPFEPIVKQMNEMGAPVTLYDLMELIEGKLSGKIISGTQDPHLMYTLIVTEQKPLKDMEVEESLFSDKNKGGPFSWKMDESKPFKEIYNKDESE